MTSIKIKRTTIQVRMPRRGKGEEVFVISGRSKEGKDFFTTKETKYTKED